MKFTHLHVHSHYSLLDGLPKIDELIEKAKEEGMEALALTDHGAMYGVIEFYEKAKKAGIKPIIGAELYLAPNGRKNKRAKIDERPYHLVLLAKNEKGYKNLIKLTTFAHLEGFYYKPRIDWELLEKYHEGLIALTACLKGEIPVAILSNNKEKVKRIIFRYKEIFGDDFYFEVQERPSIPEQKIVNENLFYYSQKFKIPVVATNDVHYLEPKDAEAHDILLCLQTKKKKEDKDRMCLLGEDFSFKSTFQMLQAFKNYPQAIENTQEIVEKCDLEIKAEKVLLPHFSLPKGENDTFSYLKKLCYQGIEKRYNRKIKAKEKIKEDWLKKVVERLEYELSVIKKTGFSSYFLIVQDVVNWAKNNGIVVGPGRGSAAGSLVSYLLNITNLDPLKYGLFFERFLNPERITFPDIDLDFTDRRRDEVIKYVEKKYGKDHVAQIITFGTMAARVAVRDVGRVLGLPYNYCDKMAKLIPQNLGLEEALKTIPEIEEMYKNDPQAKKLIDIAKRLEGVVRHTSTHACGVIITPDPIINYTPLQYASSGDNTIVSQYSLHSIETLKLLKMDFLGLKNLTIIEDAVEIIEKTEGKRIDINEIPLDDKKTFELIQKGETNGVFQLESSGMKRYLKELKPNTFEDLIAMVALYRPGPMEWIPDFIKAKKGKKKISYLHPKLKPILENTYGVIVYQEQVLQIAKDLAGFTLGEADILRKAVGKKIPSLLKEQKKKFIEGCLKNKIQKRIAEKIFSFIEPFAGYGFNRAHAACYAMIAYLTGYLKAHFPVQFMAALLNSESQNIEKVAFNLEECRAQGIEILLPDINESFTNFTVIASSLKEKKPRIRFGLSAIKNIGTGIAKVIIHERKRNGDFKTLEDFLSRICEKDLNKRSLESLIKSGALDSLGERNTLLYNIEKLLRFNKEVKRRTENGQVSLFGIAPVFTDAFKIKLDEIEPVSERDRLRWEKEYLGLYITKHPFSTYRPYLKEFPSISQIKEMRNNSLVSTGGIISEIKRVITKNKELMLFVKIEDSTGGLELLVFPDILKITNGLWEEGKAVLVSGKLSFKEGEPKIISQMIEEINLLKIQSQKAKFKNYLKENNSSFPSPQIYLTLSSSKKEILDKIKSIFLKHPGNYKVYLLVPFKGELKKIETEFLIDFNQEIENILKEILGADSIKLISQYA